MVKFHKKVNFFLITALFYREPFAVGGGKMPNFDKFNKKNREFLIFPTVN